MLSLFSNHAEKITVEERGSGWGEGSGKHASNYIYYRHCSKCSQAFSGKDRDIFILASNNIFSRCFTGTVPWHHAFSEDLLKNVRNVIGNLKMYECLVICRKYILIYDFPPDSFKISLFYVYIYLYQWK